MGLTLTIGPELPPVVEFDGLVNEARTQGLALLFPMMFSRGGC
jgi:hypothetical protein